MNILLENEFLFITKQGIFIFLDKITKAIEVKKVLTKLIFAKLFISSLYILNLSLRAGVCPLLV